MAAESFPIPVAILINSISRSTTTASLSQSLRALLQVARDKHWEVVETIEIHPGENNAPVRTATARILELAEAGRIRKVLANDISCTGRRCSLALQFLRDLHAHGVSFCWHCQEIETLLPEGSLSPGGSMILALLDEMASAENARHSASILSGLTSARNRGRTLGRPPGTKDTPDAILGRYPEVVRHLEEGLSLRKIAHLAGVAQGTVQRVRRAMQQEGKTITATAGHAPDPFEDALPVELL
jgi:DNA invertase Pin-like site-specific DNA recombinase